MTDTSNAAISKEIFDAQAPKNNGRGVTCVRDISEFVRMDMLEDARQVAHWDHDKIRSYPDIVELIERTLFEHRESPWRYFTKQMREHQRKINGDKP
jgi:hypothetical protein